MEKQIIDYIRNHPGCRKREIASDLNVWQCDPNFLRTMHDLESRGLIKAIPFSDPANMEFYDRWYCAAD